MRVCGSRQQVHDAVGDLHGKNLVEAKMYGRDSVNVRPTFKGMMRALDEHPMSAGRRAGILDWVGPRPGWEVVEQLLHALIAELADATDGDAYKNVGRRARDLFDDVAAMVFDHEMVTPGRALTRSSGRRTASATRPPSSANGPATYSVTRQRSISPIRPSGRVTSTPTIATGRSLPVRRPSASWAT